MSKQIAFMSSCAVYGVDPEAAIGDDIPVRVNDIVMTHRIETARLRGSFSGASYWEFGLRGEDGAIRIGYLSDK